MPRSRRPRAGAQSELPPLRLLYKILLLQAAYYASAIVLILFTALVEGNQFSLDLIFSWKTIRGDTTEGWTLGLCWMLNSFLSVLFILVIVRRSKLVLDFALTIHFLHLIVTSLYARAIPTNLLWWGLQCASSVLMSTLGVYSCQWRELQPMSFGGGAGKPSTKSRQTENGTLEHGEAHEMARLNGSG